MYAPSWLSHSERLVEHETLLEEGISEGSSGLLYHLGKRREREGTGRGEIEWREMGWG
jgi:hypothetical protein